MKDLVFVNGEGRYLLTEQGSKAVQAVKILGVTNKDQGDNENITKSIVKNDGTEHGNKMNMQINAIKENYVVRSLKKYRSNFDTYVVISAISLFILILVYGEDDFFILAISFGFFFLTLIVLHREYKPTSKIAYRLPAILYILGMFASEGGPESSVVMFVLTFLLYLILLLIYKPKQNN